jgi:uncharacterized protein DUF1761
MSFSVFEVKWLAVLVSGVAYFAFGAFWYGMFAKPWMAAIGKTKDQLESKPSNYIVSLVVEIVTVYFVAVALNAFGITGILDAIFVAAVVWFGFSLLPAIVHYVYDGRTFKLLVLNKGYDFVAFVIASIILAVWR